MTTTVLNHRLIQAAREDDAPRCLDLLAQGADVNAAGFCKWRPLHLAAYYGNLRSCAVLLAHGADPLAKDAQNRDPMDMALGQRKGDCANMMRAHLSAKAAYLALYEIARDSMESRHMPADFDR